MSVDLVSAIGVGQTGMTIGHLTIARDGAAHWQYRLNGPDYAALNIKRIKLPGGDKVRIGVYPVGELPIWWSPRHLAIVQMELQKRAPFLDGNSNPWPNSVIDTVWTPEEKLKDIKTKQGNQ